MKDIKFRGKRFDNGELVIGDLIENQGRSFIYHATSESTIEDNADGRIVIAAVEVDPTTVEQYIGPKNKIDIEITSDGWKIDVTVDGKTYTEHHEMSDEGCFAKCVEGNLETAGIPDPIVYALDGFFCFDCVRALRECE
jgi:hypothetical protein